MLSRRKSCSPGRKDAARRIAAMSRRCRTKKYLYRQMSHSLCGGRVKGPVGAGRRGEAGVEVGGDLAPAQHPDGLGQRAVQHGAVIHLTEAVH